MTKYRFLVFLYLIIFQILVFGNTNREETIVDYSINWKELQLEIKITSTPSDMDRPLPSVKFNTEKNIEKKLNYILLNGIELLTIDSRTKGEDYIKTHPAAIDSIFDMVPSLTKVHSVFTPSLKSITTTYVLNIYPDLAALFIPHSRVSTVTPKLDFVPSADFSGIVIYVENQLPMYGKQSNGAFSPSLFPRLFDEELNLVIGPLMVEPEIIRKAGTVGYQTLSDSLDLTRIGQNPLKIIARGIFGTNNTDLIISTREADKILSRQHNLDLILQGKILIIYDNIDQSNSF